MTIARRALPFECLGFGNQRVRFLLKRTKWEIDANRLSFPRSHIMIQEWALCSNLLLSRWTWKAHGTELGRRTVQLLEDASRPF